MKWQAWKEKTLKETEDQLELRGETNRAAASFAPPEDQISAINKAEAGEKQPFLSLCIVTQQIQRKVWCEDNASLNYSQRKAAAFGIGNDVIYESRFTYKDMGRFFKGEGKKISEGRPRLVERTVISVTQKE
ncbi:hypothetical protein AVEN_26167-1 [Araneus ventricosus]|uniref:Uncharacterized protein n=1 Tax=Araneus ventricosus TaxID=182803 RepID=A0A4Y2EM42_ARAVE|nr:hypothetical protein AVEN_26167-1 [Araneus ventricosus]